MQTRLVLPRRLQGRVVVAPPTGTQLLALGLLTVLAGTAFAIGLWISGCRWFVVETPSMATTAPVGTLVVTAPDRDVRVGDVIAFRPPGLQKVYTHRVVQLLPTGAVRTRGDLNGAEDAWTTPRERIVGRAVALFPGIGFISRAIPLLIVGGILVWQATAGLRSAERRAAGRVAGLHLVASIVLLHLHPLTSFDLLATQAEAKGLRASIVSTGLLPITLTSPTGTPLASLHDGQLAVVALPQPTAGHILLNAIPDLDWPAHALLIAVAFLPAALMILIGLPADRFDPLPRPAAARRPQLRHA